MPNKIFKNNQVTMEGELLSGFSLDHEVMGEKFFHVTLGIKRLSEYMDQIPLIISDRLIDVTKDLTGQKVHLVGSVRSANIHEGETSRLKLCIFVREITFLDATDGMNDVMLIGYICKPPVYRKTPLGREVTDLCIGVNRSYGKSDYIPSICWGRNALYAETFQIGDHIVVHGRFQSREYEKRLPDGSYETRTAYELSISKVNRLK